MWSRLAAWYTHPNNRYGGSGSRAERATASVADRLDLIRVMPAQGGTNARTN